MKLTFAFCTYRRMERLAALVAAMREQRCPIAFEILAVNNTSPDDTGQMLAELARLPGPPLRVVLECEQGIVPARNRAVEEALASDILVFIDDDEMPAPGLLEAACNAILNQGAQCVGGPVSVDFSSHMRPRWLGDDLLGFLAQVDYGNEPFWITDERTPLWTANVAYDTRIFRDDPALRFDKRYNRKGTGAGGGEDEVMFRRLLGRGARIRYEPGMLVRHSVEPWRLCRRYFLHRHYLAGRTRARYSSQEHSRTFAGVPTFLFLQAGRQLARTAGLALQGHPQWLRQAMNFSHAAGMIAGYRARSRFANWERQDSAP